MIYILLIYFQGLSIGVEKQLSVEEKTVKIEENLGMPKAKKFSPCETEIGQCQFQT